MLTPRLDRTALSNIIRHPARPGLLALFALGMTPLAVPVAAQLTPDATLSNDASIVTPNALVQGDFADLIEGGAIRGSNLFHSFSDFNVDTLQRVYFANPAGIKTILTRVTGNNGSFIDGTLGVDGLANLYLLNPNGFAFGPNAQLDIRGSFIVSTAEGWQLGNGEVFSAIDPDAPPLLAVTLTPGLQYGAAQQADVTNQGTLAVAPGESLVLLGDTVTHTGTLTAPGGQVQLLGDRVGVFDAGQIDVSSPNGGGTVNLGGGFQGQGALPTAQQTVVGPNATLIADATQAGNGGEVIVWSDRLTRFYGSASAQAGGQASNGGFVEVSGLNHLMFDGQVSTAAANGTVGTFLLDPTNIDVVDVLTAETFLLTEVDEFADADIGGDGETRIAAIALAGAAANSNVMLQATNDIRFSTDLSIPAANVTLTAVAGNDIVVDNSIQFLAGGNAVFNAGNTIALTNANSFIWTFGGNVELTAGNTVSLINAAQVDTAPSLGTSGDMQVTARTVELLDGAQFRVGAFDEDGGTLIVNATEAINISGIGTGVSGLGAAGFNASALPGSTGDAGIIQVTTPQLTISNGGSVGALASGNGNGGDVNVQAEVIEVNGFSDSIIGEFQSGIFASSDSLNPNGDTGQVTLEARTITVQGGGEIGSSTGGLRDAGFVEIIDADLIEVFGSTASGLPSGIFSNSESVGLDGDAGRVTIDARKVIVRNSGEIRSGSNGLGNAGIVEIVEADELTVSDRGQISADGSFLSDSGQVDIRSRSVDVRDEGVISVSSAGLGNFTEGGSLDIQADDVIVRRGGQIFVVSFSGGSTNRLSVNANNSISILEEGAIVGSSLVNGTAANIFLTTPQLEVARGGSISTTSIGTGAAGNIEIFADSFVKLDDGLIFSDSVSTAPSGNISVTTQDLTLTNQSSISASSLDNAEAGFIDISAEAIFLNNGSSIDTVSLQGSGGNIFVQADDFLLLRNRSRISATAGLLAAGGDGGNITINAPFIVAVLSENSDITANAFTGSGGRVIVSALDIIGLEFQDELTPFSDITASSQAGAAGITEFNRLTDVNVEEGLSELPVDLADPTRLISQQCALQASDNASEFTVVGRGGLPPDPSQLGTADRFLEDLGTVPTEPPPSSEQSHIDDLDTAESPTVIQEAKSWVQDASGHVHLVSAAPSNAASAVFIPVPCQNSDDVGTPN
ncbi:MAG: filamentous hemagglutinin N-terminal domain-containing protein [Leptolyngbya sp. SIO1E4]|nr:filamentous hemagglutinin N-terminal domain-containing protein [Leptolyngbya sp. SIO1E4]